MDQKSPTLTEKEQEIITALTQMGALSPDTAVDPIKLIHHLYPNQTINGKKIVNSPLYKLLVKNMVAKTTKNGTKPRWYLAQNGPGGNIPEKEQEIIAALTQMRASSPNTAVEPIKLIRHLYPNQKIKGKKIVNSPLYKLLVKKIVVKITTNGKKPKWYLAQPNSGTLAGSHTKGGTLHTQETIKADYSNLPTTSTQKTIKITVLDQDKKVKGNDHPFSPNKSSTPDNLPPIPLIPGLPPP